MLLTILAFIASLVPSVLIFLWLRSRHSKAVPKTEGENEPVSPPCDALTYRKYCTSAFVRGMLCALPIIALSGILFILNGVLRATLLKNAPVLLYKALYAFIVLALAEELVKFAAFKTFLKKKPFAYAQADIVAIMVIIGTGFGLLESVVFAIDSSPVYMLVRGITMGHVGYAYITGRFYAKRMQTGKKVYGFLAVLIPWLIHGLYDFSLTPELMKINANFAFLGVSPALLSIVLLIIMICYFVKAKKAEKETAPPQNDT